MGVYKVGEFIRMSRKFLKLTQEELAAEICEVVTLSRIENGRQNPSKSIYRQLMARMGRETTRAYAMASGEDLQLMEYQEEFENALKKFEYEKADTILEKLEQVIDDSPRSIQYIKRGRTVVDRALKKISDKEAREQLEEALEITVSDWKNRKLEWYPFGETEFLIMLNISNTYSREGNEHKVIEILELLYKKLSTGYMWGEGKIDIEILVLNNLANAYGVIGKHSEAINMSNRAIEICIREKHAGNLPQLLGEREWNMEQLLEKGGELNITKEQCEEELRQAYYIATALGHDFNSSLMREHYEKYFGKKLF